MIDLTSPKGKKDEASRSEPMKFAMPNMANSIADRVAQRRGHVMP